MSLAEHGTPSCLANSEASVQQTRVLTAVGAATVDEVPASVLLTGEIYAC